LKENQGENILLMDNNMNEKEIVLIDIKEMNETMITRNCIICGKEYRYKGGTNFCWKGTKDPLGIGDIVSSKNPSDRIQIWPNACCEEHRSLNEAKKYIKG
jgi:hypothetical protein